MKIRKILPKKVICSYFLVKFTLCPSIPVYVRYSLQHINEYFIFLINLDSLQKIQTSDAEITKKFWIVILWNSGFNEFEAVSITCTNLLVCFHDILIFHSGCTFFEINRKIAWTKKHYCPTTYGNWW